MAPSTQPRTLRKVFGLRRALFALLATLVTLALTLGVVGFASAADVTLSEPPATYGVQSPRVHDQGVYKATLVERTADGLRALGPAQRLYEFTWDPATTVRDAQGIPHLVHALRFQTSPFTHDSTQQISYVDVKTGMVVASVFGNDYDYDAAMVGVSSDREITLEYTIYHTSEKKGSYYDNACGIRNALQGSTVDLEGPVRLFDPCFFGLKENDNWHYAYVDGRFDAVATEHLGDVETVVFREHGDKNPNYVWMSKDVPYPVQLLSFQSGNRGTLIQLTNFEAGDAGLVVDGEPAAIPPVPALTWAPRERFGPSEAGLDHPFPLSEAYARALEDSDPDAAELREFLASHPEAMMVAAAYDETENQDWHETFWHMKFASGDDNRTIRYSRLDPVRASGVPVVSDPAYSFSTSTNWRFSSATHPAPNQVPATLPTVASLMARWGAYSGEPVSEARAWSFSFECGGADCSRPVARIAAGSEIVRSTSPPTFPLVGVQTSEGATDMLEVAFQLGDDRPSSVTRVRSTSSVLTSGPLPTSQRALVDEPSEAAAVAAIQTPTWKWPPGGYAIGAGVFAILVGVAYWLWPAVRSALGLGLFSRLERPLLLEHPVREELVNQVRANPGIHFAELVRRIGAGNGNTEHHLRHLVAQNILAEVGAKGYTCYYVPGTIGADTARALPALKSRGARAILRAVSKTPGANAQQIARAVNMSEPTVHYHVSRLRDVGLIETIRGKKGLSLRPTSAAATALRFAA